MERQKVIPECSESEMVTELDCLGEDPSMRGGGGYRNGVWAQVWECRWRFGVEILRRGLRFCKWVCRLIKLDVSRCINATSSLVKTVIGALCERIAQKHTVKIDHSTCGSYMDEAKDSKNSWRSGGDQDWVWFQIFFKTETEVQELLLAVCWLYRPLQQRRMANTSSALNP